MLPPDAPRLLGATGRFAVKRLLGAGDTALVFEALDRQTQERVALKLVRARQRSAQARQQLEREYQTLAGLDHPNLARARGLFLEPGDAYLTMELIEGARFTDHVRGAPRVRTSSSAFVSCGAAGLERLSKALPQLARAVAALHDVGLVHRDLSPANVRVTFDGRVVVIDYGMAASTVEPLATDNPVIGTAAYMAPEQCDEQSRGPASDWYGVGVLLFESLTGALPFAGTDHEVVVRKRTLAAPRPSTLIGAVPRALDDLCVELLAREPQARPSDADVLARLEAP